MFSWLLREGGRGNDDGDAVVAGLSFPLGELLVCLREEEKAIGCSGGYVGSLR